MSTLTRNVNVNGAAFPFVVLGLVLAYTVITFSLAIEDSGIPLLFLLMLIQLTPFAISYARREPNFIGYVMMSHFVSYSVAKYNQLRNLYESPILYPNAYAAVKELIICTILIQATYYVMKALTTPSQERGEFKLLTLTRRQLFIVGGYVLSHNLILSFLSPSFVTLQFVGNTAAVIVLLSSHTPGARLLQLSFTVGAAFSALYFFLKTGMLALLGSLGALFFISVSLRRRYKLLVPLLAFGLLVVAIQPVKGHYRMIVLEHKMNSLQKFGLLFELLRTKYIDGALLTEDETETGNQEEIGAALMRGFGRIGDDSLERVLAWTPEKVPFWNGETYANIPYIFVPGLLWPDKPRYRVWNKFGRTYGFLSPADYQTSVGIGYLGEAYMNFGFLGMYACALFIGLFIAFVEQLSFYYLRGKYLFSFICFSVPVLTYAADLGSILSSVVIMSAVLMAVRPFMSRLTQRDPYAPG